MKKIAFMAAVAVAASAALPSRVCAETSTDVLMWYLDLGDSPADGINGNSGPVTFDSLSFYLRATDDHSVTIDLNGNTYLNMDDVGTGNGTGTAAGIDGNFAGVYHTKLPDLGSEWAKYEFMLSAYNGGQLVAWSAVLFDPNSDDHVMLSDLTDALYSLTNGGDLNPMQSPVSATPFNFGPHVVPEPSSGLMILVGGALLALRRRRKNT